VHHRWLAVAAYLQALLAAHTLTPIAIVIFVEELGVPFLVPGDLTMMLAGVRVAQGHAALWSVLLVEEVATLAGAGLLFLAARRFGRPLIGRFGEHIGLGPQRLAQAERRIRAHGARTVFLGRLIPGLRVVTVVAAGLADIRPGTFFPALAAGGFIYVSGYTVLGVLVGPQVVRLLARLALPAGALWSLGALGVVVVIVRALRHSEAARLAMRGTVATFVVAGLISALAGALAANSVLGFAAFGARISAIPIEVDSASASAELRTLLGWPIFMMTALLVAWLYGALGARRWPVIARLVVAAAMPLALTLSLVDPIGDIGGASTDTATNLIIGATTAIRWLTFAVFFEAFRITPPRRASNLASSVRSAPDSAADPR
jgi:membrane protein DedA with SNARE-associated domain